MDDTGPAVVVGMIIGLVLGALGTFLVLNSNYNYDQSRYRKQMVELGAGFYDQRTGNFQTKACNK